MTDRFQETLFDVDQDGNLFAVTPWVKICKVDDCGQKVRATGYCKKHYQRWRRGYPLDRGRQPRSIHDECDYAAAHHRVRNLWGSASQYQCIYCAGAAKHWAYDGHDPTDLVLSSGGNRHSRHSRYPEFYVPACGSCHKTMDMKLARIEREAGREYLRKLQLEQHLSA